MSFWKNRPLIITIILVIVLITLLFSTSGVNNTVQNVVGSVIAPVQEGIYQATASIGGFFSRLFSSSDLDQENVELKEQVAQLESQLREFEEISNENERLKELLNVKEVTKDYEIVTASVVGKNPGEWFREFTVNVGSEDGIEKDMIVLSSGGLMGKVLSVTPHYSKVITLIDEGNGVPCLIERTRDIGVVKPVEGTEDDTMEILYLADDADIIPGDKVITSGNGGIYPKGLVIGQVAEVSTDSASQKQVLVKSAIDFQHVEEVVIIKQHFDEIEQ